MESFDYVINLHETKLKVYKRELIGHSNLKLVSQFFSTLRNNSAELINFTKNITLLWG